MDRSPFTWYPFTRAGERCSGRRVNSGRSTLPNPRPKAAELGRKVHVTAGYLPGIGNGGFAVGGQAAQGEGGAGAQVQGFDGGAVQAAAFAVDAQHVAADFVIQAHFGHFFRVAVTAGEAQVDNARLAPCPGSPGGQYGLDVGVDAGVWAGADFDGIAAAASDDQ